MPASTLSWLAVAGLAGTALILASGAPLRPESPAVASVHAAAQGDTAITPRMISQGDSIFHGKAGGAICFTCHGADAKGVPGLGPNLTDAKWLHGDGSFGFIVTLVEKGVPKPKEAAAPMPPKGGANLNAGQTRAVAAYVFSLSHR
jgi:mono/diheme cytochrome c family protein